MNNAFIDIRCQEPECPYGKKSWTRCKFGEISTNGITEPLTEKHKCKNSGEEIQITIMPTVA